MTVGYHYSTVYTFAIIVVKKCEYTREKQFGLVNEVVVAMSISDDGLVSDGEPGSVAFKDHAARLGARLKALRKKKLLTITQLALYTGLSVGYLSNVERGQSSPTVENLGKICRELGVSYVDVLTEDSCERDLIHRGEARFYTREDSGMAIRIYDFGNGLDAFEAIAMEPGDFSVDPEAMHPYPEMVYVNKGKLLLLVEGERIALGPGDAYCIRANHRHTMQNVGRGVCESLWVRLSTTTVSSLI